MDYAAEEVDGLLESAHAHAMQLAAAHRLPSIAFPALSCGVFGFPYADAATVAVRAAVAGLRTTSADAPSLQRVAFVLFEQPAWEAWEAAFDAGLKQGILQEKRQTMQPGGELGLEMPQSLCPAPEPESEVIDS